MNKTIRLILSITLITITMSAKSQTNDFYDDAPANSLEGPLNIRIGGEVEAPQEIEISRFQKRSLVIKETALDEKGNKFIGAYRYDGYSVYDILNEVVLKKKNEKSFEPIVDLFVVIENDEGERVILSWGEIYYPVHRHEIIIATEVARIVPSKTDDLWPLPERTKLICGSDLITERNIENPKRISIFTPAKEFPVEKGLSPMYSPSITIFLDEKPVMMIGEISEEHTRMKYESVFYGRGRGIHSTTPFEGVQLKDMLKNLLPPDKESIMKGYLVMAAPDGYRTVYTYSEVMNRNDQSEVLVVDHGENEDGGRYRLFPSGDYFSDRAIKSLSEIYFFKID